MTQSRVYDFGALLTQGRTKKLTTALFTPGIYEGFVPTVVSGTLLELSAGTFLLPNGVLVGETAVTQVTVPTPGVATDYTITADHDDIQATGGSSAFYTLRAGILGREGDPNPNSLALIWIRHTGAGPLTADMLSRPPTLQAGSLLEAIEDGFLPAPFPQACDVSRGVNITATQQSHSLRSGTASATLSASGATIASQIDVTGLVGMQTSDVGRFLLVSNATGNNNGWFEILTYVSATSVRISDNGIAPGSEAGVTWDVREPENVGLQIVNSAGVGIQTYQFRIPLPPRPLPKRIEVFADLASLASVSLSTHPYNVYTLDRTELSSTPNKVSGPVIATDPGSSPAGTFVLGNYDDANPPFSLGVTIEVPAVTAGVFIRGFNLVGD